MPILGGCLCFDLPTGGKIIGGIYVFVAVIYTLVMVVLNLMIAAFDFLDEIMKLMTSLMAGTTGEGDQLLQLGGLTITSNDNNLPNVAVKDEDQIQREQAAKEFQEMISSHVQIVKIVFIILLVLAILSVITSSMLLHGIRSKRRGLLVPWLLQEIIHVIINLIFIILIFVVLGAMKAAWITVIPSFVVMLVQIFFFVVILSQYQALGVLRMHEDMCMK